MNKSHYLFEIKRSLEANDWEYDSSVDDNVRARANGATFSMSDHIRAMVFALLSNRTPWKRIKRKEAQIDQLFDGYDAATIKTTDPELYIKGIRKEKCGNQNIKNQMTDLAYNIGVLEYLEEQYKFRLLQKGIRLQHSEEANKQNMLQCSHSLRR